MPTLRETFKLKPLGNIVILGEPIETNVLDSDGKPYYSCKLKNPIIARCSIDKEIEPVETDEVFIRSTAVDTVEATLVNPEKPEEGWFIKNWVVDFSKGQEIVLYQETTIAKWARENRGARKTTRNSDINQRIKAKMAERGKKS